MVFINQEKNIATENRNQRKFQITQATTTTFVFIFLKGKKTCYYLPKETAMERKLKSCIVNVKRPTLPLPLPLVSPTSIAKECSTKQPQHHHGTRQRTAAALQQQPVSNSPTTTTAAANNLSPQIMQKNLSNSNNNHNSDSNQAVAAAMEQQLAAKVTTPRNKNEGKMSFLTLRL